MPKTDDALFYQLYFQAPGVAEAELERDVPHSLRAILTGGFDAKAGAAPGMVAKGGGFLDGLRIGPELPAWLSQAELDVFVASFERSGFGGA